MGCLYPSLALLHTLSLYWVLFKLFNLGGLFVSIYDYDICESKGRMWKGVEDDFKGLLFLFVFKIRQNIGCSLYKDMKKFSIRSGPELMVLHFLTPLYISIYLISLSHFHLRSQSQQAKCSHIFCMHDILSIRFSLSYTFSKQSTYSLFK